MESLGKHLLVALAMMTCHVILGGSAVFLIQKRRGTEPRMSWWGSLKSFFLVALLANLASIVPAAGPFLSLIILLVGLRRLTGLDLLSTLFLGLAIGLPVTIGGAVFGNWLGVDILHQQ